ncbi:MAG: GNAT family N-acetyltransferase, partial [Candidatus Thorarchaeota archaeon]
MEIKLRPLTESDVPDILEISKTTWDGNDHLPTVIDSWFSNPDEHPFGIEVEGHVVSVGNLHVIDEGQTGWMEGLRVHGTFRQQGLARTMTDHLVKVAQELNLSRIRLATASVSEVPIKLAQSVGMKEAIRYGVFWVPQSDEVDWSHNTLSLIESDAIEFARSIETSSSMVPGNALLCHWDAYESNELSVRKVGEKARFWIGTKQEEISSLSLGFILETQHGKEWCFTIYTKEMESFKSTLSFHLNHARE